MNPRTICLVAWKAYVMEQAHTTMMSTSQNVLRLIVNPQPMSSCCVPKNNTNANVHGAVHIWSWPRTAFTKKLGRRRMKPSTDKNDFEVQLLVVVWAGKRTAQIVAIQK